MAVAPTRGGAMITELKERPRGATRRSAHAQLCETTLGEPFEVLHLFT